jgi:type IV pilus assembly protein PilW
MKNSAAVRSSPAPSRPGRFAERGLTLIEMMIAILIGLFLTGGLLTLVQAMKRTSLNQSGLSQLQDNERMAMTLITDVIKSTGYYPNPVLNSLAASFPVRNYNANANFTFAGQSLVGTGAYAAGSNVITSRYLTTGNDNIINCSGNPSGVGVAATFVNTFSLDGAGNLQCTLIVNNVASPPVPLISGITNLQIYYGVQTNGGAATNSVDTYMDAPTVTAGAYWNSVKSIMVTLTFTNPMFGQPNQPASIQFTRVIAVMDKNGVTT